MPSSPVLVFDLMDTVVVDPFFREVPAYLETTIEALLEVKHPTSWIEFERGLIEETDFLGRFYSEKTGLVLASPEAFKQVFFLGYRFVEGMEILLAELAHSYRLWVLSNYSAWVKEARSRLELDRFFEGYCVSCDTGYRKPQQEAYEALVRACGTRDCLLIDDRPGNVEGAIRSGMDGILFTDTEQLRQELARRGILAISETNPDGPA